MKNLIEHLDDIGAFIVLISSVVFIAFGIDSEIKTMFIASGAWLIKSAWDKKMMQEMKKQLDDEKRTGV